MAQGYSYGGNNPIVVDVSELQKRVGQLSLVYTENIVNKALIRTMRESPTAVKKILRADLPIAYEVQAKAINQAVQPARISKVSPIQCIIPLKSTKNIIGGSSAKITRRSDGKPGRPTKAMLAAGKNKIWAKILKGKVSVVTKAGHSQGGNPAFVAKGLAFARKGKERLPIVRVAALAVPQMPVNRSEDLVKKDIEKFVLNRFEHNWNYLTKV